MPEVEITDRLSAPAFSQAGSLVKNIKKNKEEAALHVKPSAPTARDRSLAAPSAAESQPRVHGVWLSESDEMHRGGGRSALQPGTHASSSSKSPLGIFTLH